MNPTTRYDSLFQYYGFLAGVDWRLLKAQALAESGLNPDAKSRVGALGLAQFMPATWAELVMRKGWIAPQTLVDPRDPEDAIRAQSVYMAWLLKETGNVELALASYNWGVGRVRRAYLDHGLTWGMVPGIPKETLEYVNKVIHEWQRMVRDGDGSKS